MTGRPVRAGDADAIPADQSFGGLLDYGPEDPNNTVWGKTKLCRGRGLPWLRHTADRSTESLPATINQRGRVTWVTRRYPNAAQVSA